jgi:predicted dehydrogenase
VGNPQRLSRRDFVRATAGGLATAGLASLTPRSYAQTAGANERINLGVIGCGAQGTGHLNRLVRARDAKLWNTEITAVCDVYRKRVEMARQKVGTQAQATMDYREVLDMKNVDAVLIATPDHWHAKIAMDACDAGKDVYLEKPMCHTIDQARQLVRTVRETKRVLQVGVQSCSLEVLDRVREHIKKGGIGRLVMAQSSYSRNGEAGEWRNYGFGVDTDARPGPDLDWDMFLGWRQKLAPRREWSPYRFFQFRCYWDYSGGIATDLFFHQLAHLAKAMGVEFPERVVAGGGIWVFGKDHATPQGVPDDREVPDTFDAIIDYPGGPTVSLTSSMANDTANPELIGGHLATVYLKGNTAEIRPQGISKDKEVVTLRGERNEGAHWDSFFGAMRTRQDPTCPVELGYRTNVAIGMAVRAFRERRTMVWDAERERAEPA